MQLTGGTPAKIASAAPVISSQASTPANRAASLAFLMCLDHSAAIVHAKPTGIPKGDSPRKVAPPPPSAPASNNEHTPAHQQALKSYPAESTTLSAAKQFQIATEVAKAATSRIVLQASAAAASAASAIKGATAAVQSSKVRHRSEEETPDSLAPSPPRCISSPQRSSLMGPEPKKLKSSRTWKIKVNFTDERSGKTVCYKLDGQRFLGCKLPATLKFQFNTSYKVRIMVDSSIQLGLAAHVKAHSPAYFEDSYDTAAAVPIATSDPLVLLKCTPPSWDQDLYEGKWRCMAEPVESTQRAQVTLELEILGHGGIQIPFLGKVYDQCGSVFGHHPSEGLPLGDATFVIEAEPFSGSLRIMSSSYSIPQPQSAMDAVVGAVKDRRSSTGAPKVADAKLLVALAAIGTKGK